MIMSCINDILCCMFALHQFQLKKEKRKFIEPLVWDGVFPCQTDGAFSLALASHSLACWFPVTTELQLSLVNKLNETVSVRG